MAESRSRIWIRSAVLLAGGSYMIWRAYEARLVADSLPAPQAGFATRMAIIEVLVGALCLATAIGVLVTTRKRKRKHTLRLP